MSGIYIHIPFCKRKCSYCDFHFSTSLKHKSELIKALKKELILRKQEQLIPVETIYFGGGTPSILNIEEINDILQTIYENYKIIETPEISLEANPDDLSETKIIKLSNTKINRLSIGIQSFFDDDLILMNRAHSAYESEKSLTIAKKYFDNITIDLIYGVPNMSDKKWRKNIQKALDYEVNHISSYALTVEHKTALEQLIKKGKITNPNEYVAHEHFKILVDELTKEDFIHYELSNFGKENYFSKHNTSYWLGKKYLGIGPSAHSFNGKERSWNISNNMKYIKALQNDELPCEIEKLSTNDLYNECIMTGLRTIWGVSLKEISNKFGKNYLIYLQKNAKKYIEQNLLCIENNTLKTTDKGLFLSDGISSDLFKI